MLREAIFVHFDFQEMAQRALGAHWQRRTPEEQREFIRVFSDLLEQTYVDKIESYNNEKFIYTNEQSAGGSMWTIRTWPVSGCSSGSRRSPHPALRPRGTQTTALDYSSQVTTSKASMI